MKALVLGSGEMAEEAINELYRCGQLGLITVAARRPEKAKDLVSRLGPGATTVTIEKVDLEASCDLSGLMRDADVVVNCVGPNFRYEIAVARAAIQAGRSLVDLNDEYQTTLEMYELDDAARAAGVTIVMGLGASPGVNNVLVRAAADELSEVEEIHTSWVMSGTDPGGLALSYHLLFSLSDKAFVVEDGVPREVRSFVDGRERIDFPDPVGPLDVFHIGHPEPFTLARAYPTARYVDDKATFNPPAVNHLILALGRIIREAGLEARPEEKVPAEVLELQKSILASGARALAGGAAAVMDFAAAYLHRHCKQMTGFPLPGALRVEVLGRRGRKRLRYFYSSAGRIAQGTGIPAAIGAEFLLQGKITRKGVVAPEECIDPHPFLHELLKRKIGHLNGWMEEVR